MYMLHPDARLKTVKVRKYGDSLYKDVESEKWIGIRGGEDLLITGKEYWCIVGNTVPMWLITTLTIPPTSASPEFKKLSQLNTNKLFINKTLNS